MKSDVGRRGEDSAVAYLENQGLQLVARQFRTRYGEIDSIFKHEGTYVFVEVKTRTSVDEEFPAVEAVHAAKRRRLTNAAYTYIKMNRLEGNDFRFDVVILEGDRIEWIQNAFEVSSRYTL
jgi:putative endonuclease